MSITKDMPIGDVIKEYPDAAPIMLSYGLHCVGCHVSSWETIEQGCQGHGMPDAIVDELVEELNMFVEEQKKAAEKELAE